MRILKIAGAMLMLSAPVFSQDEPARKAAVEVAARVPFEKAMKGAPYSAEVVIEGTQTLADGNRINRKTTGRVYRDGEGRTRREEDVRLSARGATGNLSGSRTVISIVDPVAGFSYSLDPENKIAWRTPVAGAINIMEKVSAAGAEQRKVEMEKMMVDVEAKLKSLADDAKMKAAGGGGRGGGAGFGAGGAGGRGRARSSHVVVDAPLERKTIEGVAVEGRKTTTTIPAGEVGNEQPITITSEEWRSPELNLLVLTRHSDPRSGESIYRLQNIIRAEPDRSLFMVPSDYTVRETGIRKMLEASQRK